MSLETKIANAVARHVELLSVLAETDLALPTLEQHQSKITQLKRNIAESDKTISHLKYKVEKEQSEHEEWKSSHVKRFLLDLATTRGPGRGEVYFLYRLGGSKGTEKFNKRAEKEEREYIEAKQALLQQQGRLETLQNELIQAAARLPDLEDKTQRNSSAQAELDALYESIFGGATPAMPEEDAAEAHLDAARSSYNVMTVQALNADQAMNLLKSAYTEFDKAVRAMCDAHDASTADMFGFDSADMMERTSLSKAEMGVFKGSFQFNQAQALSPQIASLPDIKIAQGSMTGDILFDNIFSDASFHEKIKTSERRVREGLAIVKNELKKEMERRDEIMLELAKAKSSLEAARRELQEIRESVFRKYMGEKE